MYFENWAACTIRYQYCVLDGNLWQWDLFKYSTKYNTICDHFIKSVQKIVTETAPGFVDII